MSKIDDLIKELCPDGVEYKKIKDLAQIGTGSSNGNEAEVDGQYPFFIRSQLVKKKNSFEYDEEAILIPGEGGIGDIYHYINGKYAIHQRVYRIHFIQDNIDTKFAFYYFKTYFKNFILRKAVSATVKSIRKPMIEEFKIPLPPLPIQEEIVSILDKFDSYINDISTGLPTEIQSRQEQYEYYRDDLLSFKGNKLEGLIEELCPDGVEYKKIKDIFDIKNGYTPSKKNNEYWNNGTIPWFRMEDIRENGRILDEAIQKVHINGVKNGNLYPANSIIMSTSATIGEHALIRVPFLTNQRFAILILREPYDKLYSSKFIYYYCFFLSKWCKNNITLASFASVDMTGFKDFLIPIPPLPIQEEIVRILDTFTELTAELAAELTARKEQYEYYRTDLFEKIGGGGVEFNILSYPHPYTVDWVMLRDCVTIISAPIKLKKSDYLDSGMMPIIDQGKDFIAGYTEGTTKHLNKGKYILFGDHSEHIKYVDFPFVQGADGLKILKVNNMNSKYLYYALTNYYEKEFGYKRHWLTAKETLIPIPPLPIQNEVVRILDSFDSYINDISHGLPAEIRMREQQYEYYRDKLLEF